MNINFIGVGAIGLPMALQIQQAGHQVTAWNRTIEKARALEKDGAKVAATPAACVEAWR